VLLLFVEVLFVVLLLGLALFNPAKPAPPAESPFKTTEDNNYQDYISLKVYILYTYI
jgi:hypothetical protein